ncbi:MAG TPA: FAD-dependent oxidoreductase [Casimicrobiaceae bacterium]|nr:FAD-dependent oxidoreductase [Casimicrobiaceae bacterium]
MSVPTQARIVIIGGGCIGSSIAYHLAKRGARDVVLLERLQLTHGATWHAAGLVGQLRSSSNLTRLMRYSAELYDKLEAETGQATGWHRAGSLRIASSRSRWQEFKRSATMAKGFGFHVDLISAREAQERFPLIDIDGVVGAAWVEGDGYVDPASLTHAYVAGARAGGVRIIQNVLVTALEKRGRRVTRVTTDQGSIDVECVINAAGMWGRDIAAMVGTRIAACAVEHQYFVTEKSSRIPDNLPTLRDPDGSFYVKPEPGALAVGGWEANTIPWGASGIRADFGPELLAPEFDRFAPLAEAASARIPVLNEVGIRQMINGPIPITADGEPIIGPSPELDNFYLCCGFTSGIAASGGAGWVMANWIVDGDPGLDLWPFDVRRFGAVHAVKRFMYERAVESYGRYYHIAWPNYEPAVGRDTRRSPLHTTLQQAGAVFGTKFGWERPNWFAPAGTSAVESPAFTRGPAFAAIGDEHRAIRERVALIDMSSFSKYEVRGPGALALLQMLAVNNVDRPVGTIVYTQLCNVRGGIEADVTVTRLAPDRFYFVTGSALGVRDRSTIERHLPDDGSVGIVDHTSSRAVLNVCGPRSREVLAQLTDAPLDNASFPYMSAREIDLAYAPVLALRVSYVGELGYELHVPVEYALGLYESLMQAGERFGIVNAGYRAINSLRLEKQYLAWGSDITPDYNPYEAGLGFCVAADKGDFLAQRSLVEIKATGPKRKLLWFTASADIDMFGGEIVLAGGRVIGRVTSAGYGYTVGRTIFCAYVEADEPARADYAVEVMGERFPAVRHTRPLYDPERKRLLAA